MLYIEKIEAHKIGNSTPFADVAKDFGWTIQCEDNSVETAYDGTLWEKGFAPAKSDSIKAAEVRTRRDELLRQTDKFMIADYPITETLRDQYKNYRAYLRDIPDRSDFPNCTVFDFETWNI